MNASNAVQARKRMYLTRSWMSPGPQVEEGDGFRLDNLIRGKNQDRVENKYFRDPVIRLMLAVLEDAVNCYVKYRDSKSRRGQRIFREAKEWFFSNDMNWLFSYENICDLVGINPSYLRNGVLSGAYEKVADQGMDSVAVVEQAQAAPRNGREGIVSSGAGFSSVRRPSRLRERLREPKPLKAGNNRVHAAHAIT